VKKKVCFILLLFLLACSYNVTPYNSVKVSETGLKGFVVDEKGKPEPNAFVYLYRTASTGLIGPADFMEKTDERGYFYFDIPEGKYYLVVRKRMSGSDSGPLRQGDKVSIYNKNPVIIKPGEVTTVNITLPAKTQFFYKKNPYGDKEVSIKLRNMPTDKKLFVLIYLEDVKKKSPDYIKEVNESEFTINVPSNKLCLIVVRETVKEKVEKGEFYGSYGPFMPHQLKNEINIILEPQR